MKPKIKICGITNVEDALLAESLGADFIGLIFAAQSPRYITSTRAAEITRALTRARPVGVFVEQDHAETITIAEAAGLWGIQHYTAFPQGFDGYAYIHAVRMGADDAILPCQTADYLLCDTYDANAHGGTGKVFDWSTLAMVDRSRTFLAGGLGPANICAAARENVFALDLSSSVEISPGKKDPEKLALLFANFKTC